MSVKRKERKSPEVHQCSKCGACLPACPVYRERLDEGSSPRAKVQLSSHYTAGDLSTSKHLGTMVNRCLMCGNCTSICPSKVEHKGLFMRMRRYMAEDHGEAWHLRTLYHLLSHERQLRLASAVGRFGRDHLVERLDAAFKVGTIPIRRLPRLNRKPFRQQALEPLSPSAAPHGTVLYFTGCGTNYVFDGVGQALCRILGVMGFRVEIPERQVCCGLPLFAHGNLEKALNNIQTNISLFDRDDVVAVITDCASCGSALHEAYGLVLEELGLESGAARRLGGRVRDAGEFILARYDLLEPHLDHSLPRERVTYHMPCHLRNGLGVKSAVEDLLRRLPHVDYVRAADYDSCCGGGGTFFYDYPEVSARMAGRKVENARATGASRWVTGCPGCTLSLAGNLDDGDTIRISHVLELIEPAIR